ncbi:MAG: pyridoxamine 5'-phosphate oxidase family protein [Terracidiphilus sp.]
MYIKSMMGPQKQLDLVAALLGQETTLSLATAGEDGEPCVAPLFYLAGKELSLYWFSSESSRHSLNLKRTPRAAVTVHSSAEGWKQIRGVQMRGSVSKITEPKRRAARTEAYCERFKLGRGLSLVLRQSALYEFKPEFFRYLDNAQGFGFKFELMLQPEGWTLARPIA